MTRMTASRHPALACCLIALLAGCQAGTQAGPPQAVPPETVAPQTVASQSVAPDTGPSSGSALQQAAGCEASLPPFGGRGFYYRAPRGTLSLSNDGGWCWLTVSYHTGSDTVVPSGQLGTPPSHGSVQIGPADGLLRVAYQPAPGFVGHDFFRVAVNGPGEHNTIPVYVTVTK